MKVGHSEFFVAFKLQYQFASAYKIRLRGALEWGGYFDSLSEWYCHNILLVPFKFFPRLCLFDDFEGYFISFTCTGLDLRCWPVLVLLWKGQQAGFSVSIWQSRDTECWCKACSSFCCHSAVWIRHCCKGDIWLPRARCLQIVSTIRCSCCIYDFLQSSMLAPDTVLHCQTDFYRCMVGPVLCGFWVLCPTHLAIHIIYSLTLQGLARCHWETHWKFHLLLISL